MADVAPFKNAYTTRKVAPNDAKPCHICFKSTDTVLITPNRRDWFYCCRLHLSDTNFCRITYKDDAGNSKDSELEDLNILQKTQEKTLERVKADEAKDAKTKAKAAKAAKDAKKDSSTDGSSETSIDDGSEGSDAVNTAESALADTKKKIAEFSKYKKYELDPVFYKKRLVMDYKREREEKIKKALQDGSLFPSTDKLPAPPQ